MKRNLIIKILLASVLTVGSMGLTRAAVKDAVPATDISKMIGNRLSLPSGLIQPNFNAEVKVDFRINSKGAIEVIRIHTNNPELEYHVKKQFQSLQFINLNVDTEKVYRLPVKYRVI